MSPREQSISSVPAKRDHRQEVTDSIVKMLEDGVAPWQKPSESAGMPFNPTTEKAYRGGNAIHLMATGLSRGYEDPRWMTYNRPPRMVGRSARARREPTSNSGS
jgi:antirestriction protein ArdC